VWVHPRKPVLKPPGPTHLKLTYDGPHFNFAFNFNLRRYDEGARPQVAGEAWLRVAECSAESIGSERQTLASDGFATPRAQLATQLAASIRIPQESNTRKRAGIPAQQEVSKRFFTAPMVGAAHLDPQS
jgi:hypothetical protein